MNSTAHDLAIYLQAQGVGTIGTDLFVSALPSTPDVCSAVIDSGSWREFQDAPSLEHPTAQVICRGERGGFRVLYATAKSILDTLVGFRPDSIGGTYYGGIWHSNGPNFLGYDESKRPLCSLNFRVMRSG